MPDAFALIADLVDLRGAGLEVLELDVAVPPASAPGVVRVGVHRGGPRPTGGLETCDILLSADPSAPRPWVGLDPALVDPALSALREQAARQPVAAAVAAQVFRLTLAASLDSALALESLAYSTLLASSAFKAWREAVPPRERPPEPGPFVRLDEAGGVLRIQLDRPAARNAFNARLRDELCEALAFAAAHPDAPLVELSGAGPAFSAGGDLDEFGRAGDPGLAHLVRTLRSPARLAHALGERLTARLHGACVGAGIEVPAAAHRVLAAPGAVFSLPEVSMGLIPGAGGTATIARRIGRRRACYMALSGAVLDAGTALAWGLVDEIAT